MTKHWPILRKAATQVPDGNFPAMQAWIYIGRGEELVKARSLL